MKNIFSDIYHRWAWGGEESVSGPGSGLLRTSVFRDEIPILLKEIKVRSLLDAGCGDLNWMKELNVDLDKYIGIDIVPELIDTNRLSRPALRSLASLKSVAKQIEVVVLARICAKQSR